MHALSIAAVQQLSQVPHAFIAATTAEPSAEFKPTRRLVAQVFYVSRVLFGFYMNGVVFCMPILFRYSILTEN